MRVGGSGAEQLFEIAVQEIHLSADVDGFFVIAKEGLRHACQFIYL
jgi:hypothetical protein